MEKVNDEEALRSKSLPEKNDFTNNFESGAMTSKRGQISIQACNDSTNNFVSEAMTSEPSGINDLVFAQGKVKEESMEKVKSEEIIKENSEEKVNKSKTSKKNIALGGPNNEGSRVEGSGMIFMCNSKTKKDCYNYKVLGFPGSKRDTVSKIYKGMRLFLFDIDLKLMYGIYKAAGPGGYNLEPKAFSSAYPSQVRFTVLDDCTPLAEEKFRPIIKDNYYTRNKFTCQLTSEQVKKLCKLFQASNKGPKSERPRTGLGAGNHSLVDLARNRLRDWEEKRHQLKPKRPEIYEREALVSPGVTLPQCPLPLYAYDMTSDRDVYRRELPLIENHELRHSDHGRRFQYDVGRGDPYIREPALYRVRLHSVGVPVQYQGASSRSSETHPLHPSHPYRL